MMTLDTLGAISVAPEAAQFDKLTLRYDGNLLWLDAERAGEIPLESLARRLANGRSVFGRRMNRDFRLHSTEHSRSFKLLLRHPRPYQEWAFRVELELYEPRISAPNRVRFVLKIILNPTRQMAHTGGRIGRTVPRHSVYHGVRNADYDWAHSNMLPDEVVLQPVANGEWVDGATQIAEETSAFVVEELFGEPPGSGWVHEWAAHVPAPSLSTAECLWEFSTSHAREAVRYLTPAFTGGAARSEIRRWVTVTNVIGTGLCCPLTKQVEAALYAKGEADNRIRLEFRYKSRLSTAVTGIGSMGLGEKLRAVAADAARRATPVLRLIRPHLSTHRQVTLRRFGELAKYLVDVLGNRPQTIHETMTEMLLRGGINAGEGGLISLAEAVRLVGFGVLQPLRMTRSTVARSFPLEAYFIPLCHFRHHTIGADETI